MFIFANLLTLHCDIQAFIEYTVAPYVGAWIETAMPRLDAMQEPSHPTWVRGLKLSWFLLMSVRLLVAPYVGAWIETGTPTEEKR